MFCFVLLSLLLSFFINGSFIGRYLGHRGSMIVSISLCFVSLVTSILIWYEVIFGNCEAYINLFGTWISIGTMNINWDIYYDSLSVHMLLTVSVVSFAVHCYSMVYMKADPHLNLFISYLSLFTFFMAVLVSANNMLSMFVGFEGIGICSYLLIGYWSNRLTASKSALKAIVVNRISDGLLLWSIIWLWWYTGSLEYDLILLNDSNNISSFINITLLLGCMAKLSMDLVKMHYLKVRGLYFLCMLYFIIYYWDMFVGSTFCFLNYLNHYNTLEMPFVYCDIFGFHHYYSTKRRPRTFPTVSGKQIVQDQEVISVIIGALLGDSLENFLICTYQKIFFSSYSK